MNLDALADMACAAAKEGRFVVVDLGEWKRPVGFPFPAVRGNATRPWEWPPERIIEYVRLNRKAHDPSSSAGSAAADPTDGAG